MSENGKIEREERASGSAEVGSGAFSEQNEDGIDLSLIRENLRLTPAQRLEKMQRAAESLTELRRASRNLRLPR